MDTHLEEMLREGMKRQTDSVSLPDDLLSRAVGRYRHRRVMVRRLVASGAAVGVVALAIGLVFGVVLPRAAEQPSVVQITVSTAASAPVTTAAPASEPATAPVSTTTPAILEAVPVALLLQKTLATLTPAEGEVLHIKTTSIFDGTTTDKGIGTGEIWQIGGSSWMWRDVRVYPGKEVFETAESWSSPYYNYDGVSDSLLELPKSSTGEPRLPAGGWQRLIQSLLTSGQAVKDGHEQIDGKDAIRIVEKVNPEEGVHIENVFLVDATTDEMLEIRLANEGETIHFDLYETLPATPENLALMDMKAAHPTATVYTDKQKQAYRDAWEKARAE
jgi:hypothetical protein